MSRSTSILVLVAFVLAGVNWGIASEITVNSVETLKAAVSQAVPGDMIIVSSGDYSKPIDIVGRGSDVSHITIRSEQGAPVVLNGPIYLRGSYLSLEGFDFGPKGRVEFAEGRGHRLWRCRFDALKAGHWVRFQDEATHCEIGYCSFTNDDNAGESGNQQIIQILRSDETGPDYHHIHHNYFANVTPGEDSNGFETIQLFHGAEGGRGSSQSIVEYNVFERCNGEVEMISVKCSDNIIRYNLIKECRGGLVVRKGTGNLIEGNVFLGNNVEKTSGIRFQGNEQIVVNNFMSNLAYSAISLHNGDPENYYDPVQGATIAFNTIINCGRAFNIGVRHPKLDSSISPVDVVIANNILVTSGTQIFDPDGAMASWKVEGNLAFGTTPELADLSGFTFQDPLLVPSLGGIFVPTAGSPAITQAQGEYPDITKDIYGTPRSVEGKTIGAVEFTLPELPVSRATVGPDAAPHEATSILDSSVL
ncbi:polysaccharide lyase 6 family protein [Coraliomargarita algicola]|uniref:Polysaccharide lyase 6 family protein n=1 Tax=Coraliomargarita algicola TaxID=3092156 RepID=A0ABZ0RNN5_9BACT|nr:polysaccharide lyase 6 family protein [Coraliomargarita sp. J2-16]WPJ97844.1 polysaccharide lyase 6 family protein [Coraliomargarita sp. J2-16]